MVRTLSHREGERGERDESGWRKPASEADFGHGAVAGAAYAEILDDRPMPPISAGVAYGLALWAVGCLGRAPDLRILPPATGHRPPWDGVMMAAHAAWGAATGLILDRLLRPGQNPTEPVRRPPSMIAHRPERETGSASGPAAARQAQTEAIALDEVTEPAGAEEPRAEDGDRAGKVDLNRASRTDLIAIKGIGGVLAGRIIAYRTEHGRIRTVDDLDQIEGFGPSVMDLLRRETTV